MCLCVCLRVDKSSNFGGCLSAEIEAIFARMCEKGYLVLKDDEPGE